jgi:uncharacterized membrane protein
MGQTKVGTSDTNVGSIERWASAIGGGALIAYGVKRRDPIGAGLALLGGALTYRGATGHCPVYQATSLNTAKHEHGIRVVKSITINREPEEIYQLWRNFENLPRIMEHLEAVVVLDDTHSHWVAKGPAGKKVEWDAEIINDVPNKIIAWRSLESSDVDSVGAVNFDRAPGGRGTVIQVEMEYNPPAGVLGATIAKLFGEDPAAQIENDLRKLKQRMEAGEMPTTKGQPHGRSSKRTMKAKVIATAT